MIKNWLFALIKGILLENWGHWLYFEITISIKEALYKWGIFLWKFIDPRTNSLLPTQFHSILPPTPPPPVKMREATAARPPAPHPTGGLPGLPDHPHLLPPPTVLCPAAQVPAGRSKCNILFLCILGCIQVLRFSGIIVTINGGIRAWRD